MIDRIREQFAPQLGGNSTCLQEHNHQEFYVHDPHPVTEGPGPCYVLTDGLKAKSDLLVRNSAQRTLHFIAIDHCIYGDANPSKCDCALISNNHIYFVEFKTSENQRNAAQPKINANPGDCLDQLAASIRDFYDRAE